MASAGECARPYARRKHAKRAYVVWMRMRICHVHVHVRESKRCEHVCTCIYLSMVAITYQREQSIARHFLYTTPDLAGAVCCLLRSVTFFFGSA